MILNNWHCNLGHLMNYIFDLMMEFICVYFRSDYIS
jgi:hypothetical protein